MSDNESHTTRLTPTPSTSNVRKQRIELFYRHQLHIIEASELPFRIGRDSAQCDLVIKSDLVSRMHCVLQMRGNVIGLQDTSTNGTSVRIGSGASLYIHNKFCPLAGHGALQLGQHRVRDDADVILFKVISH